MARGGEPAKLIQSGQAVFATALNGDIFDARADCTPGVIWDRQLYEFDVFGMPEGDPKKDMALDFIRFATGSQPLAGVADWVPYGPARRSALPLVGKNPGTGHRDARPSCPPRRTISPPPSRWMTAGGWTHGAALKRAGRPGWPARRIDRLRRLALNGRDDRITAQMLGYALRRFLGAMPTLFIIITARLLHDARSRRAARSTASASCRPRSSTTSRRPITSTSRSIEQYFIYLGKLAHGDLGPSFKNKDFTVSAADRRRPAGQRAARPFGDGAGAVSSA